MLHTKGCRQNFLVHKVRVWSSTRLKVRPEIPEIWTFWIQQGWGNLGAFGAFIFTQNMVGSECSAKQWWPSQYLTVSGFFLDTWSRMWAEQTKSLHRGINVPVIVSVPVKKLMKGECRLGKRWRMRLKGISHRRGHLVDTQIVLKL